MSGDSASIDPATYRDRFAAAVPLREFVATAEANAQFWRDMLARASVTEAQVERAGRLPGPRRLLVLLEDWCGDAVNTIPVLAALADRVPSLELRVLRRDEHPDLMDAHPGPRGARSIPVVIVIDGAYRELGWWGSRPRALREWVETAEAREMSSAARYREIRRWYAQDHGRTAVAEVLDLLERPSPSDDARRDPRPAARAA